MWYLACDITGIICTKLCKDTETQHSSVIILVPFILMNSSTIYLIYHCTVLKLLYKYLTLLWMLHSQLSSCSFFLNASALWRGSALEMVKGISWSSLRRRSPGASLETTLHLRQRSKRARWHHGVPVFPLQSVTLANCLENFPATYWHGLLYKCYCWSKNELKWYEFLPLVF